ncbi:MAG TPA: response regulator [Verrucomicrobiota bacterium]|nr:response regulator [Verrucomicrobiota bacterium]HNT14903.1 response regulator [Verrucomicrobiota bacterium]
MKSKILVVDDDQSVRVSLEKLLEAQGYEVFSARDARDATEIFRAQSIDLIVLDINLGSDNTWALFDTLALTQPFTPTIAITAEWGQHEEAVARGVEGLIEKPIDVPEFLKMIRELLEETRVAGLRRVRGDEAYCRYVSRHYEPYLRMLQQRYAAPYRSDADPVPPRTGSEEKSPTWPDLVPAGTVAHN